jgi:hypothetical protein
VPESSMRKHLREVIAARTQTNINCQCCEYKGMGRKECGWFESSVSDFELVR